MSQYLDGERPDFAAILYGAGSVGRVPDDAPPVFIVATADDPVVSAGNSTELFSQWRSAGHSAELHIYAGGGHGFGMLAQGLPSDHWIEAFHAWLHAQKILNGQQQ
jgi:acetyl esterase/lipase